MKKTVLKRLDFLIYDQTKRKIILIKGEVRNELFTTKTKTTGG